MRYDGRETGEELRQLKITRDFIKYPQGSVLIEMGDTKVICTAMIEDKVPQFLKGSGSGWVSAQYAMLPAANATRKQRDIDRLKLDGRSAEIQRLIGRSLRAAVDLKALGERTVWIDCDVIQADGGTRVTSINGGFIALYDAVGTLISEGALRRDPIKNFVGAVSLGIVDDEILTDLCYHEDSRAQVDMNVVMTSAGEFVEVQTTGEGRAIRRDEMSKLLELAESSVRQIIGIEKEVLGYRK